MVSPTVIGVALTIIFSIVAGLVGLAYKNLRRRVRDLEEDTDTRSNKHNGLSDKVETLWKWAFGVPDDETDAGLSGEISEGFDRIEEDIEETQRRQKTHHDVQVNKLERIITELHHADDLSEVGRDDLKEDE